MMISAVVASAAAQDAEKLMKDSDCSSCHALDRQVVGPAYSAIAKSHAGQTDAVEKLATTIRDGGNGMTPHPDLTEAQRTAMAKWVLSQSASATGVGESETKTYPYKLKDGS